MRDVNLILFILFYIITIYIKKKLLINSDIKKIVKCLQSLFLLNPKLCNVHYISSMLQKQSSLVLYQLKDHNKNVKSTLLYNLC
jgi:hypothetical protein